MEVKTPVETIRYYKADGYRIPIVSLRAVRTRDNEGIQVLAQEIKKLCKEVGFFYIEDHGVSEVHLRLVKQAVHDFFSLPASEKMKILISKSPYHRGYVPPGEENAYGLETKDIKEVFDMALELPPDDPDVLGGKWFHGPNAWPEALPHFKPIMLWLYREWLRVCEDISELFAIALDLPQGFFIEKSQRPLAQLRAALYPQQPHRDDDAVGCGLHTDYGVVTIIWQVDEPGLEIRDVNGRWINAPSIPGTFICPLGDAISIWTNDYWPATPHRVVNKSEKVRHSLAFFYDQDFDCMMQPLPRFVTADHPSRYKPTTMAEHVKRGFDGTFSYRSPKTEEGVLL
jgi:isopenicillin N synthase-like dioxygenase